jgi:prepilin-type N-terminal cleavage/methylation domain-containing protein
MSASNTTRGFSLIEVVAALALLSIALSCALSILPLSLQARNDVEHLTAAGLTAENLLSEILAPGRPTHLIDLASPLSKFFALDEHGNILRTLDQTSFNNGTGASAIAAIRVSQDPAQPGLSSLNISVEWPGAAPARARTRQTYNTLIPCPRP